MRRERLLPCGRIQFGYLNGLQGVQHQVTKVVTPHQIAPSQDEQHARPAVRVNRDSLSGQDACMHNTHVLILEQHYVVVGCCPQCIVSFRQECVSLQTPGAWTLRFLPVNCFLACSWGEKDISADAPSAASYQPESALSARELIACRPRPAASHRSATRHPRRRGRPRWVRCPPAARTGPVGSVPSAASPYRFR